MHSIKLKKKQEEMLGNKSLFFGLFWVFFSFFALLGTSFPENLTVILRSCVTVKVLRIKFSLSSFSCLPLVKDPLMLTEKENTFI